ncbi:uncharacterized protein LOC133195561 [Saccostrea echinata]|uniref:uncharacterized protein LOC133195561 n=1 Tax=Saccostrea echinata TaxID=191078 RepID=UPI002A818E40|nr:uncharacterized protein LOC133195561 [Saccostrea echinata]
MDAYKKIKKEVQSEALEEKLRNKPLPWQMFCTSPTRSKDVDTVKESKMSDVVKAKDGMSFNIEFKSTIPRLPPIKLRSTTRVVYDEEYEKWKDERDKLLREKQEKAEVRRKKTLTEEDNGGTKT